MPSISWSAKHAPDPDHPGYVKVVGSYAHDFLQWAKLFGKPAWSPQGDACVLGFMYWPLAVLEPIYEGMQGRSSVGLIDPRTGEPTIRSAI